LIGCVMVILMGILFEMLLKNDTEDKNNQILDSET